MRIGAGTFVGEALNSRLPPQVTPKTTAKKKKITPPLKLSKQFSEFSNGFVDRLGHKPGPFTTAMPALDVFPGALWSKLASRHWRGHPEKSLGYGDSQGYLPLREAIVSHLRTNRGIECNSSQVFTMAGAQQAFNVIANVLVDVGDLIWFENPGAIGARNCFVAAGGTLVPLPVDKQGLVISNHRKANPDFRLAFVTPIHQQPTGATMSLGRRLSLLEAAESANAFIIEDDYDGEFSYTGHPLPTLKSIDTAGRVLYVGTFSKTLFPALRLGYVVVADGLLDAFSKATSAVLPGTPLHTQALVASFMQEGYFASHLRRMRKIYAERLHALLKASDKYLHGKLEVLATNAGLHTVGYFAKNYSEFEISRLAAEQGVTVTPLARFCIQPIKSKGLVLGFSGTNTDAITKAVKTLSGVFDRVDTARSKL